MTPEEFFYELKVPFLTSGQHHHISEGWLGLKNCPFCGSENYHLGFNLAGKYFVCWHCGSLHPWKVLEALGASRPQIKDFIATRSLSLPTVRKVGRLQIPHGLGPMLGAHRRYLRERGYDPFELELTWGLKGIGIDSKLPWRIYIPVIYKGEQVSWTTRTIGNSSRRYISASEGQESYPHKHCIYGIDYACHSLVIVEGPADAWRVGPGAGALFGTAFTPQQVVLISRFPYRYILFDNEAVAQRQARKLADQLSCFPGETSVLECDAEDPGEMSERDVLLLRKKAKLCR